MSLQDWIDLALLMLGVAVWFALGYGSLWLSERLLPTHTPGRYASSNDWDQFNRNQEETQTMTVLMGPIMGLIHIAFWLIFQTLKLFFRGIAWLLRRGRSNLHSVL